MLAREDVIKQLKAIEPILEKDNFYSKFPEDESDKVRTAVNNAEKFVKDNEKNKISLKWVSIQFIIIDLRNILTTLYNKKCTKAPTNAKMIWKRPGSKPSLSFPIQFAALQSLRTIIMTIEGGEEFKKAWEAKRKIDSFNKIKTGEDERLKPYQKIFSAILKKYPQTESWLNWTPVLSEEVININNKYGRVPCNLRSRRGIKEKKDAKKWCHNLKLIEGFQESISVQKKGKGWFLVINSPEKLVKQLEELSQRDKAKAKNEPKKTSSTATALRRAGRPLPTSKILPGPPAVKRNFEQNETNVFSYFTLNDLLSFSLVSKEKAVLVKSELQDRKNKSLSFTKLGR